MATLRLDGVDTSEHPLDLRANARDLWPMGTLEMWQGTRAPLPSSVCWPESDAQVAQVLREAHDQGVAVVPYGAGSGVCGGARGLPGSVVLDLKRLSDLGTVDERRWTIDVGAGVIGQQLEDHLNRHGFTLGHSPSSIWCSTVGGWAAARSAGQFSSKYGVFEDMVLSVRGVSPSQGVFNVGVNGEAPDEWMPLLLGSEGTLAAITRVRLRIQRQPECRVIRGYRMSTISDALTAMRRLMQAELWPSVVRLYDPVDTQIGGKTRPKSKGSSGRGPGFVRRWLAEVDKLPAVRKRTLGLPLRLPGMVNRIFSGISSGCLLLVGFEGPQDLVDIQSRAGFGILREHGEDLGEAPGQRWFASRHAVSYKLMPIFERGGFADTMEVATTWSGVEPLYRAMRTALGEHVVVMAHMSHAYPEGAAIYFSFAGEGDLDRYRATWAAALETVVKHGGTVSHHHGIGILKAGAASREAGAALEGWRSLKRELDPNGIMNPGRLYTQAEAEDPPPEVVLTAGDGLVRGALDESGRVQLAEDSEALWPWESLPAPRRYARMPWQTGWIEVAGKKGDTACRLGRAPRSASGTDLREWLAREGEDVTVTVAAAPPGDRWMGEGTPRRPWAVARDLLRGDLRPSVLRVVGGKLQVGFRGPAAHELGALANNWVPGGLTEVPYEAGLLPSGPLESCALTDEQAITVTKQGAFRRSRDS